MVTLCASTVPRRMARQEVIDHIAILEQVAPAQRRAGAWPHDKGWHTASLRRWGTTVAAGALFCLPSAWAMPWYGVVWSAAARQERGTQRMAPLLAIGVGTLSWLAAVVIV